MLLVSLKLNLPLAMQNDLEVLAYQDVHGRKPFLTLFGKLNDPASARVSKTLTSLSKGHFSDVKPVGEGVLEYRIHFGPGYRVYFSRDGHKLIILLAGGDKKSQSKDIETAKIRWQDYKTRR